MCHPPESCPTSKTLRWVKLWSQPTYCPTLRLTSCQMVKANPSLHGPHTIHSLPLPPLCATTGAMALRLDIMTKWMDARCKDLEESYWFSAAFRTGKNMKNNAIHGVIDRDPSAVHTVALRSLYLSYISSPFRTPFCPPRIFLYGLTKQTPSDFATARCRVLLIRPQGHPNFVANHDSQVSSAPAVHPSAVAIGTRGPIYCAH